MSWIKDFIIPSGAQKSKAIRPRARVLSLLVVGALVVLGTVYAQFEMPAGSSGSASFSGLLTGYA